MLKLSSRQTSKYQQTLQLEAFQRGGRHWEEIAQAVGSQTNPYACFVQYQRSSGGGGGGGTGGKHEPMSEEQRQSEREWRAANRGRGGGGGGEGGEGGERGATQEKRRSREWSIDEMRALLLATKAYNIASSSTLSTWQNIANCINSIEKDGGHWKANDCRLMWSRVNKVILEEED